MDGSTKLVCPKCGSDVHCCYGKTMKGVQKYKCLICGRQFTRFSSRSVVGNRPSCPQCGKPMHSYMKDEKIHRFRCAGYPYCKSYKKLPVKV